MLKKERSFRLNQTTMPTKAITLVGVMAALVFAATYFLKINMPLTMGYVHLGDSMIFLAVYLFGWKKGALAGAIGGAMSDLIGGYVIWIVPTFAIKFIMAMVAGLLFDLIKSKGKYLYIATYIFAGLIQVALYSLAHLVFFGVAPAISGIPGLLGQTYSGLIIALCLIVAFEKAHVVAKIKQM